MFRNRFLRTKVRKIRFEDVRSNLEDDGQLFGFLEKATAGRSLPSREMMDDNDLDPGMIDVFLKVLWNGSMVFDSRDSVMVRCFRMGFIHRGHFREESSLYSALANSCSVCRSCWTLRRVLGH